MKQLESGLLQEKIEELFAWVGESIFHQMLRLIHKEYTYYDLDLNFTAADIIEIIDHLDSEMQNFMGVFGYDLITENIPYLCAVMYDTINRSEGQYSYFFDNKHSDLSLKLVLKIAQLSHS